MDKMMAYCGLICSGCDAYKATVNNDDAQRQKIAEEWSKAYGADIKAEHINCLGCNSEKRLAYCGMCQIRACCIEKRYNNCSDCESFGCEKLSEIFKHDPGARERLEKARG
ncbi:MAG: DUF3795 domain-containing protein [Bacillota bacterium]